MKGQLEIFGLAIVFVLILLGLLLYLRFAGTSSNESEEFYLRQMPGRMLNSMKETTTDCRDQNLENLIVDVAEKSLKEIDDETYPDKYCKGIQSQFQIQCYEVFYSYDIMEYSINTILEGTLEESFINYDFSIEFEECTIFQKSFNVNNATIGCSRARKVNAETLTFATNNGKVDMILRIC